uniref:Uncharacterized protein n=1 Tax=Rhizophora mucronata TaxID=61149 RepID=A0A2P2JGD4_RHIMU
MEQVQKISRNVSKQIKPWISSSSSSEIPYDSGGKAGVTATLSSSDESRLLVARPPRYNFGFLLFIY